MTILQTCRGPSDEQEELRGFLQHRFRTASWSVAARRDPAGLVRALDEEFALVDEAAGQRERMRPYMSRVNGLSMVCSRFRRQGTRSASQTAARRFEFPLGPSDPGQERGPSWARLVEARPPNLTDVVPVKFVPAIVTEVPTGPLVGERELIVHGCSDRLPDRLEEGESLVARARGSPCATTSPELQLPAVLRTQRVCWSTLRWRSAR